jgi:DNA-binding CsgD family transcriptional regulator
VPASSRLEAFIERIKKTDTREGLQDLIQCLRDVYGVDHVIYHSVNSFGEQYAALTYDVKWVERYLAQNYTRIDPVVLGAMQRFSPFDWKTLDWSGPQRQAFLKEALAAGVGNQGYSVPIRGPNGQFALFTVNQSASDEKWEKFTRDNVADLLLISHYIHQQAQDIDKNQAPEPLRELSPRETDALTLLGLGYGRGQVAEKLQISENTLRVYIDSARYKLGALNTTHAVALATARGVIMG